MAFFATVIGHIYTYHKIINGIDSQRKKYVFNVFDVIMVSNQMMNNDYPHLLPSNSHLSPVLLGVVTPLPASSRTKQNHQQLGVHTHLLRDTPVPSCRSSCIKIDLTLSPYSESSQIFEDMFFLLPLLSTIYWQNYPYSLLINPTAAVSQCQLQASPNLYVERLLQPH